MPVLSAVPFPGVTGRRAAASRQRQWVTAPVK
jgi:hypothetical protein